MSEKMFQSFRVSRVDELLPEPSLLSQNVDECRSTALVLVFL